MNCNPKKISTHDIASKLGINRETMDEILFDIKCNNWLLEHCDGPHDFSITVDRTGKQIDNPTSLDRLKGKSKCSKCEGTVDNIWASWYKKGLTDAAKAKNNPAQYPPSTPC